MNSTKMSSIITVSHVSKRYNNNFQALDDVSLEINKGEIFALLGPNGAGKTTLISIICGLVNMTSGQIKVNGFDIVDEARKVRQKIGLVPQELYLDLFETVYDTVTFSRGLFGLAPNPDYIESLLKQLSLWDKKDNMLRMLSGGMKRRVMIAKALSHEPNVLFLDEPTAGVDVELRQDMWAQVSNLRDSGVTIILTTHYIEEAEKMADRIGIIRQGELKLVEKTETLMKTLGKKNMMIYLDSELTQLPKELEKFNLEIDGSVLIYHKDQDQKTPFPEVLEEIKSTGLVVKDIETKQRRLEDIFVELVNQ